MVLSSAKRKNKYDSPNTVGHDKKTNWNVSLSLRMKLPMFRHTRLTSSVLEMHMASAYLVHIISMVIIHYIKIGI